jgi:hypothetical protein
MLLILKLAIFIGSAEEQAREGGSFKMAAGSRF